MLVAPRYHWTTSSARTNSACGLPGRECCPLFWFPPSFLLRTKFMHARTEGHFAATDPWNGGRPTHFTIEVYKRVPKIWDARVVPDRQGVGPDYLRLRSALDGREHWLPESLVELWRMGRVASEALPRQLHELQPHLRKSSYFPALHQHWEEWFSAIFVVVCLGLIVLDWVTVVPEDGVKIAAIIAAALALLGIGVPAAFVAHAGRERRRCRKEMAQILASRVP
jgi:hypothetical protein